MNPVEKRIDQVKKAIDDGTAPEDGLDTLIIRPSRSWVSLNLADLWKYRELLYFLIWRDIKVRYKQRPSWAQYGQFSNPL